MNKLPVVKVEKVIDKIRQILSIDSNEDVYQGETIDTTLPRLTREIEFTKKDSYHVRDFLHYHDEDFIKIVYNILLKRNPDTQGFNHYLHKLRTAKLNKVQIIGRLKYSREAKQCGVEIKGLLIPYIYSSINHIPVIGYITNLVTSIIRLPRILKNQQEYEAFTNARLSNIYRDIDNIVYKIEENFVSLVNLNLEEEKDTLSQTKSNIDSLTNIIISFNEEMEKTSQLRDNQLNQIYNKVTMLENNLDDLVDSTILAINQKINDLDKEYHELNRRNEETVNRLQVLQNEVNNYYETSESNEEAVKILKSDVNNLENQVKSNKITVIEQQRRISVLLEEVRKKSIDGFSESQYNNILKEENHFLDSLYVSFEDKYRGTREDIKLRVKIYLPYIIGVSAGSLDRPILDIGCGRGEWLELVKENGYIAKGIDLNRVMVQQCKEMELDVVEAEVLTFLRTQKNNSYGAITGFHIIEHLSFDNLIKLFDEVYRVLKPGGIMIFETPNPENLLVGAYSFRYDPTHVNPLVPDTISFVAEQRGFSKVEILRLHKRGEPAYTGQKDIDEVLYKINMEQDFSVIGYKV